jgi:hypothetical protein
VPFWLMKWVSYAMLCLLAWNRPWKNVDDYFYHCCIAPSQSKWCK